MINNSIRKYQLGSQSIDPPHFSPPPTPSPPPQPVVSSPENFASTVPPLATIKPDPSLEASFPPTTGRGASVPKLISKDEYTPQSLVTKVSQSIQEMPLVDTTLLNSHSETVSWKRTVIISVITFFCGILIATTVFFLVY